MNHFIDFEDNENKEKINSILYVNKLSSTFNEFKKGF